MTTSHGKSHGCRIAFAFEREAGAQTSYSRDVAPVLQKHCVQCHREGGIGPWNMNGYGHVKNYSKMMQEVLLTGQMPPWHADPAHGRWANERSLTAAETQRLLSWISEGAQRGDDPEPLPPLPDWPLGKPDFIPEEIPANGVLDYPTCGSTCR